MNLTFGKGVTQSVLVLKNVPNVLFILTAKSKPYVTNISCTKWTEVPTGLVK